MLCSPAGSGSAFGLDSCVEEVAGFFCFWLDFFLGRPLLDAVVSYWLLRRLEASGREEDELEDASGW